MKRTGMLLAAASTMLAVGVPDWKDELHAATGAYGTKVYEINGGTLTQKLKVAGCKTLNSASLTNVEFYDDGTYYYAATDGTPVRGNWALAAGTFYLDFSSATLDTLFDVYNVAATLQCQQTTKYPTAVVEILEPSAIISKNYIKVNAKNVATGSYMMKGKQVNNNMKAPNAVGNFNVKLSIKGNVIESAP